MISAGIHKVKARRRDRSGSSDGGNSVGGRVDSPLVEGTVVVVVVVVVTVVMVGVLARRSVVFPPLTLPRMLTGLDRLQTFSY